MSIVSSSVPSTNVTGAAFNGSGYAVCTSLDNNPLSVRTDQSSTASTFAIWVQLVANSLRSLCKVTTSATWISAVNADTFAATTRYIELPMYLDRVQLELVLPFCYGVVRYGQRITRWEV